MRNRLLQGLMLSVLLFPAAAKADIFFNLDHPVQLGAPGDMLTYSGTFQNTGTTDVFLNADSFSLSSPALMLDDTKYLLQTPILVAAKTTTGSLGLFDVTIDPMTAPGTMGVGTFSVLGGADSNAQDLLAIQTFQVGVVPEPGTVGLLAGSAVFGLGVIAFRRRRLAS